MMIYIGVIKVLDRTLIRSHHCHILKKLNMVSSDHFIKSNDINSFINNQTPWVLSEPVALWRTVRCLLGNPP